MNTDAKYEPRPARPDEAELFFAMTPEKDSELGCIGSVRMDFERSGKEFWHTWYPRGSEELNSPEFKSELDEVVNSLRENVLKSLPDMKSYCRNHGGKIDGGWEQNYGYVVETERYLYYLRCNPVPGDYAGYLTCLDKQAQELNQAQQNNAEPQMGGMALE